MTASSSKPSPRDSLASALPNVLLIAASLWLAGLAPTPQGAHAESIGSAKIPWEWVTEDEGVKVWKRQAPGQDLPAFRGKAQIDASIAQILEVILQNEHHTKWMHKCVASDVLQQISERRAVVYNRTEAPWPIWDRDVVLDTSYAYNADHTVLTLNFAQTRFAAKPQIEGVVRMPRLRGYYKMKKLSDGKTLVTYQVDADIGGSLPRWMVPRVTQEMPVQTLSRLRARVLGRP